MTEPSPPVDPFAPSDVVWHGVDPRLARIRFIAVALWTGVPALAAGVIAIATRTAWVWGFTVFFVLLGVWVALLVTRQVRAIGYAERAEDLLVRKGVLFRSLTVVPYGRMQYVDVSAGPLARALGLASVQLHTASAATDADIPGLPAAEAARLRDQLASRGQARLAGL